VLAHFNSWDQFFYTFSKSFQSFGLALGLQLGLGFTFYV